MTKTENCKTDDCVETTVGVGSEPAVDKEAAARASTTRCVFGACRSRRGAAMVRRQD